MSNLSRWLKTSTEQYDDPVSVMGTIEPTDTAVDDIVSDLTEHAHEMSAAGEAREALEAYADLVSSLKAQGKRVDSTLAKAIYIGCERHHLTTDIMPSVESFGGLSVSVELLDTLKKGAKAVGSKIKEIYEYIVNLLKRLFGVINNKTEKIEQKQEEIKKAIKTVEPINGGDNDPKPVDPAQIKADVVVLNGPNPKAPEAKEEPKVKEEPKAKEPPRKNHKEYFVRVKNASLLFYAGYCQPYHATIVRNCFHEMDQAMEAYFKGLSKALDELFPSGHSSIEDAEKRIYEQQRRSPWVNFLHGTINGKEFERDYNGSGSGFDTCELQISVRNKDRPRSFIGSYLSINFKTVPAQPKYGDPYLVRGPSQGMLESLIDVSTQVLFSTDDLNKINFEKEMAPIKDSAEAVDNARMLFINLNYARVLAEYLNYRTNALNQLMDCIAAIVLRNESVEI